MLELIGKVLFIFLAIVGITECYRFLLGCIFGISHRGKTVTTVHFQGHEEDAEYVLRSVIERTRWLGGDREVLCVDCGMDAESRKICELLAKKHPFVHIVAAETPPESTEA